MFNCQQKNDLNDSELLPYSRTAFYLKTFWGSPFSFTASFFCFDRFFCASSAGFYPKTLGEIEDLMEKCSLKDIHDGSFEVLMLINAELWNYSCGLVLLVVALRCTDSSSISLAI